MVVDGGDHHIVLVLNVMGFSLVLVSNCMVVLVSMDLDTVLLDMGLGLVLVSMGLGLALGSDSMGLFLFWHSFHRSRSCLSCHGS